MLSYKKNRVVEMAPTTTTIENIEASVKVSKKGALKDSLGKGSYNDDLLHTPELVKRE